MRKHQYNLWLKFSKFFIKIIDRVKTISSKVKVKRLVVALTTISLIILIFYFRIEINIYLKNLDLQNIGVFISAIGLILVAINLYLQGLQIKNQDRHYYEDKALSFLDRILQKSEEVLKNSAINYDKKYLGTDFIEEVNSNLRNILKYNYLPLEERDHKSVEDNFTHIFIHVFYLKSYIYSLSNIPWQIDEIVDIYKLDSKTKRKIETLISKRIPIEAYELVHLVCQFGSSIIERKNSYQNINDKNKIQEFIMLYAQLQTFWEFDKRINSNDYDFAIQQNESSKKLNERF